MALSIAAGCSLLALGGPPLVHGRPGVRRAIGLVLVTQAVLLIRLGIGGPSTDLEEVARAALLVTAAASGAALTRAAALVQAARRGEEGGDSDADAEPPSSAAATRRPAGPA